MNKATKLEQYETLSTSLEGTGFRYVLCSAMDNAISSLPKTATAEELARFALASLPDSLAADCDEQANAVIIPLCEKFGISI